MRPAWSREPRDGDFACTYCTSRGIPLARLDELNAYVNEVGDLLMGMTDAIGAEWWWIRGKAWSKARVLNSRGQAVKGSCEAFYRVGDTRSAPVVAIYESPAKAAVGWLATEIPALAGSGVWGAVQATDGAGRLPRRRLRAALLAAVGALDGRTVLLVPDRGWRDNDMVRAAIAVTSGLLSEVGALVRVVEQPACPCSCGDVSDLVVKHGEAALTEMLACAIPAAEEFTKMGTEESRPGSLHSPDIGREDSGPWPPPIEPEGFYGLAGDIVRTIEPHSEGDRAALLVQLLVFFGNVIGRGPHSCVEGDRHFANLYCTLVGRTAKGRKGTSWGQIRRLAALVDPAWAKNCLTSGLSSGEGLIWQVRDPLARPVAGKAKVEEDPGVSDKRLLAVEGEFAQTLAAIGREGSTLSPLVRQAWDAGDLRALTKNSPARASDAHISIVAHVTCDELRRRLTNTESGNGFANRFLWVCVTRSKALPEGGSLRDADLEAMTNRLRAAIDFGRSVVDIQRDAAARAVWAAVYPILSEGLHGLVGAVTARAEAQVLRLSMIFALLDQAREIRTGHLLAALAVWDYCAASAQYIFGTALGDPVADELLRVLRSSPDGRTRTQIRDHFGRNKVASDVDRALSFLSMQGLAHEAVEPSGGRPAHRWTATTTKTMDTTKGPTFLERAKAFLREPRTQGLVQGGAPVPGTTPASLEVQA